MVIPDIKDFNKEFTRYNVVNDFTAKYKDGTVSSLQSYYDYLQQYGYKYSARVVDYEIPLKRIEAYENAIKKDLPPL